MKTVLMLAAALVLVAAGSSAAWAQELETETARVLESGTVEGGVGVEYQVSSEGSESAVPTFIELGLFNRFELMIEQVAFTAIRPKTGVDATGAGDLEITFLGLVLHEGAKLPALALAGEVKVPTAGNQLIGTGETDYTGYVILSKRLGDFDTHLDFGYAAQGAPPGVTVGNLFSFAAAVQYVVSPRLHLFGEVLGNVSTAEGGEGADGGGMGAQAEVAGGELFGTLGAGYAVVPSVLLSLGVSYDNTNAVLFHPGLTIKYDLL